MRNLLFSSLLFFLCIGCATTPPEKLGIDSEANTKAPPDHGLIPTDPEGDVKRLMETVLKDSESARYQFGTLYKARSFKGLIRGGGYHYGFAMDFKVNAKNSYGGYTGFEPMQAFWVNGMVHVNRHGSMMIKRMEW